MHDGNDYGCGRYWYWYQYWYPILTSLMASDPEGQLSDQSDIPANSEVSEVVINWGVSKDNL